MYDWVLIHDVDEYVLPVNWDLGTKTSWCKSDEPTLVSVALQSMLDTARSRYLYSYQVMNQSKELVLNAARQCKAGSSMNYIWSQGEICRPISAFILPERIWMGAKGSDVVLDLPSLRGRYHSIQPETSIVDKLTQAQEWKSFHCVAHSPVLEGSTTYHYNNIIKTAASVLAPRDFHKEGVSLEIAHYKPRCTEEHCMSLLLPDKLLQQLNDQALRCGVSN